MSLPALVSAVALHLTPNEDLETRGLTVITYQNLFHPVFRDQKLGGIEIILHGERIATDGEVRLMPTPEQWDAVPTLTARHRGTQPDQFIAESGYPDLSVRYKLEVTAEPGGFKVAVRLEKPLPAELVGKAGFNMDFLPTAYFGKSYSLDRGFGIFPRHPDGPMAREASAGSVTSDGTRDGATGGPTGSHAQPLPLATGHELTLSPEDPLTRVTITSDTSPVSLYDARNVAQNGWFVVRSLLPAGKTDLVWHVHPNVIPGWTRAPVVSYNQVGYTPRRQKVAVVELDPNFNAPDTAQVVRLSDGKAVFQAALHPWGKWLRYQYATFDFSPLREAGVYAIEYAGHRFPPFRISPDVYRQGVWQPSLDTYLAEQMDHIEVRENYRVWHGVSHRDDARQAPLNYTHFDGYAIGPTSDSPFKTGQHIPGIDVGGWFDAGDYDIRTQTQARVITDLVLAREGFGLDWDQTTVDEDARLVRIRRPDGVPDVLQQIQHGVLALLAQYGAFGHAIPGIIEPTLEEYTHLGDAASKTDGKIYDGSPSSPPDDRWAFTTHVTALNYEAAAALAAASRVLPAPLAQRCLKIARQVWQDEHRHAPALFHSFNTTGGDLDEAEIQAAVELLLATRGDDTYRQRLNALLPVIRQHFARIGWIVARALPWQDASFKQALEPSAVDLKAAVDATNNPFGVPISTENWGGSATVTGFANAMYYLHTAFPEVIGSEYTLRGFDYVLGRHPGSNVSLVSSVGTSSKLIAYGNNRADYSFIAGGMVPGVVIIKPDFPELKSDWPFLWYENEYVVDAASSFILVANEVEKSMQ